jgi:hypothetical protein
MASINYPYFIVVYRIKSSNIAVQCLAVVKDISEYLSEICIRDAGRCGTDVTICSAQKLCRIVNLDDKSAVV